MARNQRTYDKEYKAEAVKLAQRKLAEPKRQLN